MCKFGQEVRLEELIPLKLIKQLLVTQPSYKPS